MKFRLHIIVFLVLALMSFRLLWNYRSYFSEVEQGYAEGRNVNLVRGVSYKNIAATLMHNGYMQEQEDADFVARMIVAKFGEGKTLPNVYALKKRDWQVGGEGCCDRGQDD